MTYREFFAQHGNVSKDINELMKAKPTEAQLEQAVQSVIDKAILAKRVILDHVR